MLSKALLGAAKSAIPVYIEEVFSTYLYTGNGSTQTITNGIDLSTYGGLVWRKSRTQPSGAGYFHKLMDTARGTSSVLFSNTTDAAITAAELSSFNNNGFTMNGGSGYANQSGDTYASWTFRKQAKFFDVVTYTGNGINGRQISHNLGSTPGTIIVKVLNAADNWPVWHRSAGGTLRLDSSEGTGSFANVITTASSTTFTVTNNGEINGNGYNYVAYIFAHDAGGFGLSGTDNVITCGSFSSTGSGGPSEINLGYEPQWVMLKTINSAGSWTILDNMRGWVSGTTGDSSRLFANLANAESVTSVNFRITSTGFTNVSGTTNYIYIAIRRGPMKTPTSGTSVFNTVTSAASGNPTFVAGFPVDFGTWKFRNLNASWNNSQRLTSGNYQEFNTTAAEASYSDFRFDFQNGWASAGQGSGTNLYSYCFRRAPGFFDVVCYTGNGSTQSVSHNLGVAPELIIVKWRNGGATDYGWRVYHKDLGITKWGQFTGDAFSTASSPYPWDTPTSSVFKLGDGSTWLSINGSSRNFVAYLFATVGGVSKVGSYTGTGTTKQIDCGFTAGARFVMIKRTDSTGDWYVWDTARGIVSGNDPYLLINSTAAEVTSTDYIDPLNAGFEISSTAPAAINANGGTFIFLAIS